MKVNVWSYRNKKQVFFEKDRFYVVKSHDHLNEIIFKLMDIDAVSSTELPKDVKFPVYFELENLSFGPTLVWVEKKVVLKAIEQEQKSLKKLQDQL